MLRLCLLFCLLLPASAFAGDFHVQLKQAAQAYDQGNSEASLDNLRQAIAGLWEKLPFSARQVRLLRNMPDGGYQVKPDNTYHSGESLIIYLEPIGFKVVQEGELYLYNLEVDFILKDAFGHYVASQKRFSALNGPAISFPGQLPMVVSYNLLGLTPGDYHLQTILRDVLGKREHAVTSIIHILSAGPN